jgi:peptidoglycan/xylan/chitin deacetylase (PgdA/CDA1 family)
MQGLRSMCAYDVPILAYHRVRDYDLQYPFDVELISATPEQFRWQVQYISKHFTPIRFSDLVGFLDDGCSLPANPILVTFDDGFLDNYEIAFPILRDMGVPATFFVTTGYVYNTGTFWFDEVCHMILTTQESQVQLEGGLMLQFDDLPSRRQAVFSVLQAMKRVNNVTRLAWLESLRNLTGVHPPPEGWSNSRVMTWEQIRDMDSHGMEIGSHTVTHPILSQVSDEQLICELADSKEAIRRETGTDPCVLAYPVGKCEMVTEKVVKAVKETGYRTAVAYFSGVNRRFALNRYSLYRVAVERYTEPDLFRASLSLPEVFLA